MAPSPRSGEGSAEQVLNLRQGRIELIEKVGEGGFGEVHYGLLWGNSRDPRKVAVKRMRAPRSATLSESAARERASTATRLRDEINILQCLAGHESIVEVVGIDDDENGDPVAILGYALGADVSRLLQVGRLPPCAVAEILLAVAGALDVVHTARDSVTNVPLSLIHRDVKPANIQVSPEGHVRLLDFGIAKGEQMSRASHTQTGMAVGTEQYMAPERLRGLDVPVGDVYSLGLVGLVALVGPKRLDPYDREAHDQVLELTLGKLCDVPRGLVELLRSMLDFDPQMRPDAATVRDKARGLVRLLASGSNLYDVAQARMVVDGWRVTVVPPASAPPVHAAPPHLPSPDPDPEPEPEPPDGGDVSGTRPVVWGIVAFGGAALAMVTLSVPVVVMAYVAIDHFRAAPSQERTAEPLPPAEPTIVAAVADTGTVAELAGDVPPDGMGPETPSVGSARSSIPKASSTTEARPSPEEPKAPPSTPPPKKSPRPSPTVAAKSTEPAASVRCDLLLGKTVRLKSASGAAKTCAEGATLRLAAGAYTLEYDSQQEPVSVKAGQSYVVKCSPRSGSCRVK